MKIYRTHFLPKNSIFQIAVKVEADIRQSYTGGAVDVYVPNNHVNGDIKNNEFITLYAYDANSLYASVKATTPMPCGKQIAFSVGW